jgi:hypothetical protein
MSIKGAIFDLPRIISKAPAFRLGMKVISNLKIKKRPVL